jgi:hypothetical protein
MIGSGFAGAKIENGAFDGFINLIDCQPWKGGRRRPNVHMNGFLPNHDVSVSYLLLVVVSEEFVRCPYWDRRNETIPHTRTKHNSYFVIFRIGSSFFFSFQKEIMFVHSNTFSYYPTIHYTDWPFNFR